MILSKLDMMTNLNRLIRFLNESGETERAIKHPWGWSTGRSTIGPGGLRAYLDVAETDIV